MKNIFFGLLEGVASKITKGVKEGRKNEEDDITREQIENAMVQ